MPLPRGRRGPALGSPFASTASFAAASAAPETVAPALAGAAASVAAAHAALQLFSVYGCWMLSRLDKTFHVSKRSHTSPHDMSDANSQLEQVIELLRGPEDEKRFVGMVLVTRVVKQLGECADSEKVEYLVKATKCNGYRGFQPNICPAGL